MLEALIDRTLHESAKTMGNYHQIIAAALAGQKDRLAREAEAAERQRALEVSVADFHEGAIAAEIKGAIEDLSEASVTAENGTSENPSSRLPRRVLRIHAGGRETKLFFDVVHSERFTGIHAILNDGQPAEIRAGDTKTVREHIVNAIRRAIA